MAEIETTECGCACDPPKKPLSKTAALVIILVTLIICASVYWDRESDRASALINSAAEQKLKYDQMDMQRQLTLKQMELQAQRGAK